MTEDKSINLGHPSYVWRFGQERRLDLIRQYVDLEGKRILDVGCGIGTYVRKFRQFSDEVFGVDVDPEKVEKASLSLPNISLSPAETLPFEDNSFDMVLLHEVIEHVDDDMKSIQEAFRVLRPGGRLVIYAPNRLYFFETHGFYLGKRYIFGNIPLVNYFPGPLRNRLAPHVRAYLKRDIHRLFKQLPAQVVVHTYVYPGFDNIVARNERFGLFLRKVLYFLETTPMRSFGLSHFVVVAKTSNR